MSSAPTEFQQQPSQKAEPQDVIVVGAGVIGVWISRLLAESGLEVCLVERRAGPGLNESLQSAAMVMSQIGPNEVHEPLIALLAEGVRAYNTRFGNSSNVFTQCGSFVFSNSEASHKKLADICEKQKSLNPETQLVRPTTNLQALPTSFAFQLGTYAPIDGFVHMRELCEKLLYDDLDKGRISVIFNESVIGFTENEDVVIVDLQDESITAKHLVLATGIDANELLDKLGRQISFSNNTRMLCIFESNNAHHIPILEDADSEWYVKPNGRGQVLVGIGVVEEYDPKNSNEVSREDYPEIENRVRNWVENHINELHLGRQIKAWKGHRSRTIDNLPIIDTCGQHRRIIVAAGMCGWGVSLGPSVARVVRDMIFDHLRPTEVAAFSFSRSPATLSVTEVESVSVEQSASIVTPAVASGTVLADIAREFGTPLYVYDTGGLEQHLRETRRSTADAGVELYYSVKANPNRSIVSKILTAGIMPETASIREIKLCIDEKHEPSSITYGGPGKRYRDIQEALELNVGTIDVESPQELRFLNELSTVLNVKPKCSLRVNVQRAANDVGERMAGGPSRFGIDTEVLPTLLASHELSHVRLAGIHAHVASQVLDEDELFRIHCSIVDAANELEQNTDLCLDFINLGGGLGVSSERQDGFELRRALLRTQEYVAGCQWRSPSIKLHIELGRYLVAAYGVYLCEIVDVKFSRGEVFVIVDAGIAGFTRPIMPWAEPHECHSLRPDGSIPYGNALSCSIVGRSCLPGDVLVKSTSLVDPRPGDYVVVHDAGAYGFSMSLLEWGSHTPVREIEYNKGEVRIIGGNS